MSENQQGRMPGRRTVMGLGIALFIAVLLVAAGYAGYLIGQSNTSPEVALQATTDLSPTATSITLPVTPDTDLSSQTQIAQDSVAQDPAPSSPTAVPTAAPTLTPDSDAEPVIDAASIDLSTFTEVWDLVEREFDGEMPEEKERLYGAISGSLQALDDEYTRFVRPEIAERLRDDMDGSVSGIGAIVRPHEEGFVEIVRPIDAQPADRAGLKSGDLIVAVDGQSVTGMTFDEVLLLVRGPEGSTVVLTIARQGEDGPLEFSIVRAEFEVPIVETNQVDSEIGPIAYIKLNSFTRTAEEDVAEALSTLLVPEAAGIILDLRDNGGGFLDQAVAVGDLFLPEGVILYERSKNGLNETFRSESGDLGESLPLVVLVNEGSASASEIVAGAIKDNGRGLLVGTTTFGKGSVQHVHTLEDGSELRVTIARWFTPSNQSISDNGIAPDVEIVTPEDLGGADDVQLQRAVDLLVTGE